MKPNERELPENSCTKLPVKLLIFYANGKLNKHQEHLIDAHCGECDKCRNALAYIYEIIKGKETLSLDQQTLLLKYLHDPIYKNNIEKIKKSIKKEILSEIKLLLADNNQFTDENSKDPTRKADNNTIYNLTDENKSNTRFSDFITKNLRNFTSVNFSYSSLIFILSIIVFFSLSIFTYLALTKSTQKKSISSSTSSNFPKTIIPTPTKQEKKADNNLYQQLDSSIEQYLESKNLDYLKQAENIAKDIQDKYKDNYGTDLVSYYRTVPLSSLEQLLIAHKSLSKIFDQILTDNYQQHLKTTQKLEKDFLSLGNMIEAYKAKFLSGKLYEQLYNHKESELITEEGLKFSIDNKYLFLKVNFLLWKAKRLSQISDFITAEEIFLEVIEISNKLNLYKNSNSAASSLAMIYYRNDENEKAFNLCKKSLENFSDYNNTQAISFLQVAGLSAFSLHYNDIAVSYLKKSITYSEILNAPAVTARSYAFLALIISEQNQFDQANDYFLLAEKQQQNISDDIFRQETLGIIIGYQAKANLLKKDYNKALELYQSKLNIIEKLHLNNNLEISQINEAMAMALLALGQKEKAQEHIATARRYHNIARVKKETNNCLLSLAPSNCSPRPN